MAVGEAVLADNRSHLNASNNPWDWLGNGIYFWENDPQRALEFAQEAMRNSKKSAGRINPNANGPTSGPFWFRSESAAGWPQAGRSAHQKWYSARIMGVLAVAPGLVLVVGLPNLFFQYWYSTPTLKVPFLP